MNTDIHLQIPDEAWTPNSGLGRGRRARHCLLATLVINGYSMHLEAWAVTVDEAGIQRAVDDEYEDSLGLLHEAVSGDGHFDTTNIGGREYILVASPFC